VRNNKDDDASRDVAGAMEQMTRCPLPHCCADARRQGIPVELCWGFNGRPREPQSSESLLLGQQEWH
jgi:hypothetical protein